MPIVDIITGGSPCQDLSVAGKRAGLEGERSGLFMEQIRIIKEMREHDRADGRAEHLVRPRYMVFENVPGLFSSPGGENRGKDFQAVLTEIVRIAEPNAPDVPLPEKGKWSKSGCIYDDMGRWSIAWRLHDAQFWGVSITDTDGKVVKRGTPQRRKRVAVVADFGGLTAPDILFDKIPIESESLSRDFESSSEEREGAATRTERSTDSASGFPLMFRAENTRVYNGKATTICSGTRPGYANGCLQEIEAIDVYNQTINKDVSKTLNSAMCDSDHIPCVKISYDKGSIDRESSE